MRSLLATALVLVLGPVLASDPTGISPSEAVRYANLRHEAIAGAATLANLEAMVAIYGEDGHLWWELGRARLQAKQYDQAIAAYRKAIELGAFANKFHAGAHYDIACAHALKGEKEAAFKSLKTSMDLGFRDLGHVRMDADLTSLHSDPRWEGIAATKDVSKMTRDEAWRYDLWLMVREAQRIHYAPYAYFPKAEQDRFVRDLRARIPRMTDDEVMAQFMVYMARLGDGHTGIRPNHAAGIPSLPVQLFWFSEGVFVTAAHPKFADLAGAQVLEVNGRTVDELAKGLEKVIIRDNPQGIKAVVPRYLTLPRLLKGLGLGGDGKGAALKVKTPGCETRMVDLPGDTPGQPTAEWAIARPKENPPLYLKARDKAFFFEPVPALGAVYVQYNAVRNEAKETTEQFAKRLFDYAEANNVERLIVDVRWNGGGNSFLNRPIVNGLIGAKRFHERGRLFVITGRNTFSAAQNFTTDLDRAIDPIFVGEPTGSSPNFVGETVQFVLPYSKMQGSISDLYWQRSWPMDHRIWIAPELPAPPSFELFRQGRDPALEAIAAFVGTNVPSREGNGK